MNRDKPHAKADRREPGEQREGLLGTHPVGTAVGGVAGAAAVGAVVGGVAGPIGAAVGAGIGAAAGGMSGKLIADLVDPQLEEAFWRKNWSDRKYIDGGFTYDQDWGPAYRYGVEAYRRYPGQDYEQIQPQLASGWGEARGNSRLEWEQARHASQDAWHRVDEQVRRGEAARKE